MNRHDPEAEEKFKEAAEAYEILSDAERRATYDRFGFEGLESRGFASQAHGFGSFADIFDAFFGGDPFGARSAAGGGGRVQGGDVGGGGRDHARAGGGGTSVEVVVRAGGHLRALPRQRRRAGHADRDLPDLRRRRAACARSRGRRSASSCASRPATTCGGDGQDPRASRARSAAGAGGARCARRSTVDIPAGIADEQRIRLTGRGHAGERGGPPGDLYVLVRVAEDERFLRDGSNLVTVVDVPGAGRGARHEGHACRRSTARRRSRSPPGPSRAPS